MLDPSAVDPGRLSAPPPRHDERSGLRGGARADHFLARAHALQADIAGGYPLPPRTRRAPKTPGADDSPPATRARAHARGNPLPPRGKKRAGTPPPPSGGARFIGVHRDYPPSGLHPGGVEVVERE
jgi:hypothetical protein